MTITPPAAPPAGISPLVWAIAAGQARHLLTVAGGALITNGVIKSDQEDAFVEMGLGVAAWAVGAGWSWWQKDGQALVKAQLDRLTHHVQNLPIVPSNMPQAAAVNSAIEAAQIVADRPHAK